MSTVGELIQRLLPRGSRYDPHDGDASSDTPTWDNFPIWPPDVFAVTALLVERSAAYRRLADPPSGTKPPTDNFGVSSHKWRAAMSATARAWAWGLALDDTVAHQESLAQLAMSGMSPDDIASAASADIADLQRDWDALWAAGDMPVTHDDDHSIPEWWAPAIRLLITADQACAGAGFHRPPSKKINWLQYRILFEFGKRSTEPTGAQSRGDAPKLTTIASPLVNATLCAVLPKTRTASVGCTLRSLTHNLALLPPASQVEARWALPGTRPKSARDRPGEPGHPLNLLLVPYPYRVLANDFKAVGDPALRAETGMGFYEIDPSWLNDGRSNDAPAKLANYVSGLVSAARKELGTVHGVIFPEIALNAACFEAISERLKNDADATGFEFIVAGCSEVPLIDNIDDGDAASNQSRNVALYRSLAPSLAPDEAKRWGIFGGRDKHHRWKLNPAQVKRYGLGSQLAASVNIEESGKRQPVNWWESIPLKRRIVEFYEVRAGTSMTVLICEDLARADPCQQVIRAIGPNLVIALLFDGPQLAQRWPGHYAGVLADDPGSSVLTLTSLGLIERAATGDHTHSRSVALFRDCLGDERLIQLPYGSHAVAVRLDAQLKEEHSLDGRGDGENAYVWKLGEVVPISAPHGTEAWILG